MRVVRSPVALAGCAPSTCAALHAPGVVAVWTGAGRRRGAADRFPPDPRGRAGAVPPADRARVRALRGRAGGLRVGRRRLSRGGRRGAGGARDRGAGADRQRHRAARRICPAFRARPRPSARATAISTSVSSGARGRRARARDWPAQRRAPRDARRDCSLRCRPRSPRAVRRRQGAALQPRCHRRDARYGACALQLFEGHVGGGFGIRGELYPRTFWSASRRAASADRSSGSRIATSIWSRPTTRAIRCTGACGGRCARLHSRPRGRVLGGPGRLRQDARRHGRGSGRGHAARPLRHSGLSGDRPHRLTNKTPAGTYARPAATRARSCASA